MAKQGSAEGATLSLWPTGDKISAGRQIACRQDGKENGVRAGGPRTSLPTGIEVAGSTVLRILRLRPHDKKVPESGDDN